MKVLALGLMILVSLVAVRSASAECICNHLPCPCASARHFCPRVELRICPIPILLPVDPRTS